MTDKARQAYFQRRKLEIPKERFRARLRATPIMSPCKHDAKEAREGGWLITKYVIER